jgi:hypothetical protein
MNQSVPPQHGAVDVRASLLTAQARLFPPVAETPSSRARVGKPLSDRLQIVRFPIHGRRTSGLNVGVEELSGSRSGAGS